MNITVKQGLLNFQRWFNKNKHALGIVGVGSTGEIHITSESMGEWAPLEAWTINQPRGTDYKPFAHTVVIDGVTIFAMSDEPIVLAEPADEPDGDMANLAHFDKTLSADGQTDDANGLSPDGLPNGERR